MPHSLYETQRALNKGRFVRCHARAKSQKCRGRYAYNTMIPCAEISYRVMAHCQEPWENGFPLVPHFSHLQSTIIGKELPHTEFQMVCVIPFGLFADFGKKRFK